MSKYIEYKEEVPSFDSRNNKYYCNKSLKLRVWTPVLGLIVRLFQGRITYFKSVNLELFGNDNWIGITRDEFKTELALRRTGVWKAINL